MQTEQQSILERIKVARGTSEPAPAEPTENNEPVDVNEEVTEEVIETESEPTEVTENELLDVEEAEEEQEQAVSDDDDTEDLYVEYQGREINLKDVIEWEQSGLRQSDYTRKTQELSDNRKAFEADREAFNTERQSFNEKLATLEAMISEDEKSAEELAELREYEPEEFIKHQEKMQKRKEFLSKAKDSVKQSNIDVAAERQKLWGANPSWMDNGKQTQAFTDDMNLLQSYAEKLGYSNEEISSIQSARHWQTMLDAAKYQALNNKNAAIEKKVRKAPVTTKPRQQAVKSEVQKAREAFKKNPTEANAVRLRKAQRGN
jgi:hypothetical protein